MNAKQKQWIDEFNEEMTSLGYGYSYDKDIGLIRYIHKDGVLSSTVSTISIFNNNEIKIELLPFYYLKYFKVEFPKLPKNKDKLKIILHINANCEFSKKKITRTKSVTKKRKINKFLKFFLKFFDPNNVIDDFYQYTVRECEIITPEDQKKQFMDFISDHIFDVIVYNNGSDKDMSSLIDFYCNVTGCEFYNNSYYW